MSEITIKTYTTKGFKNEGVIGSTPVKELDKKVDGITPDVMNMTGKGMGGSGVEKIANAKVKQDGARGEGMSDTKPVDKTKGGPGAGNVGGTNMNHS